MANNIGTSIRPAPAPSSHSTDLSPPTRRQTHRAKFKFVELEATTRLQRRPAGTGSKQDQPRLQVSGQSTASSNMTQSRVNATNIGRGTSIRPNPASGPGSNRIESESNRIENGPPARSPGHPATRHCRQSPQQSLDRPPTRSDPPSPARRPTHRARAKFKLKRQLDSSNRIGIGRPGREGSPPPRPPPANRPTSAVTRRTRTSESRSALMMSNSQMTPRPPARGSQGLRISGSTSTRMQ